MPGSDLVPSCAFDSATARLEAMMRQCLDANCDIAGDELDSVSNPECEIIELTKNF
jgi:hypothetical protein